MVINLICKLINNVLLTNKYVYFIITRIRYHLIHAFEIIGVLRHGVQTSIVHD